MMSGYPVDIALPYFECELRNALFRALKIINDGMVMLHDDGADHRWPYCGGFVIANMAGVSVGGEIP